MKSCVAAAVAVAAVAAVVPTSHAFVGGGLPSQQASGLRRRGSTGLTMKIDKEQGWRDQQEILARRKDKKKMNEYNQRVNANRRKADEAANKWAWQRRKDGKDTIYDYLAMKAKGEIPALYDEDENPEGGIPIPSASFGVGGEFGVGGKWDTGGRFDLQLPYVDQGYVDESKTGSWQANLARLFGKQKTDAPTDQIYVPTAEEEKKSKKKKKSMFDIWSLDK